MACLVLRPRLEAAAGYVPQGGRLLDVGTDHARLPAALVQRGQVRCAVATDVGQGPLRRAEKTLETVGLTDRVTLLCRDGLRDLDPEICDTLTITGMGGETIAQILQGYDWPRRGKRLILQPTTGADALRRFLEQAGYQVVGERLTLDAGRLYQTLCCGGGTMRYTHPAQYFCGTQLEDDPLFPLLLEKLERRFTSALAGLEAAVQAPLERRRKFEIILEEVRRLQCRQ